MIVGPSSAKPTPVAGQWDQVHSGDVLHARLYRDSVWLFYSCSDHVLSLDTFPLSGASYEIPFPLLAAISTLATAGLADQPRQVTLGAPCQISPVNLTE